MCYTEEDSWTGYAINMISCFLLFSFTASKELKVIALFLGFVGQMQLFDAILWRNQECNSVNKTVTKLAIVANHIQPLVLVALQILYGFQLSNPTIGLTIFYILLGIHYNYVVFKNVSCTKTKNGVLNWEWNKQDNSRLYYKIFIILLFSASFNFKTPWIQWTSAIATIFTFFAAIKTPILNESLGRIWCYYASIVPLGFLVADKVLR